MKGAIFAFILLIGVLFVSVAEARISAQLEDNHEFVIKSQDFDLVVDLQSYELQAIDNKFNFEKDSLVGTIELKKFQLTKEKELVKQRRFSNPGKLTLACNYEAIKPIQVKYMVPWGLRN
jgi:hypothetical protein